MLKRVIRIIRLTIVRELLDYLAKLVEKRSEEPTDDLISHLVVNQLRPGHIEQSDAVQIAFLLLVAGNATMVNMIALVIHDTGMRRRTIADSTRGFSLLCNILNSWRS